MISSTFLYKKSRPTFAAKLSLVSLMDIFTILVFFLLLNSGESENLAYTDYVELPKSVTGTAPHKELVVLIGKEKIFLEDKPLTTVEEILKSPDKPIEALITVLNEHTEAKGKLSPFEKQNGLSITIMGDKSVRYDLLKSVMTTCRLQNYRNISLAVSQAVSNSYSNGEGS